MRSHLLLALSFAAIPSVTMPAHAAGDAAQQIGVSSPTPETTDSLRLRSLLTKADEASFSGRFNEARRLYRRVINEQDSADEFASVALWRLATAHLWVDARREAAEVLDELARSANKYGDPETELRATFEAAVIWSHLKRHDLVAERVTRVRTLFKSPAITDELKDDYRSRIREDSVSPRA